MNRDRERLGRGSGSFFFFFYSSTALSYIFISHTHAHTHTRVPTLCLGAGSSPGRSSPGLLLRTWSRSLGCSHGEHYEYIMCRRMCVCVHVRVCLLGCMDQVSSVCLFLHRLWCRRLCLDHVQAQTHCTWRALVSIFSIFLPP